ncbi:MAG: reverse transcriptase N-terminal domain-containing protein [bacterium]
MFRATARPGGVANTAIDFKKYIILGACNPPSAHFQQVFHCEKIWKIFEGRNANDGCCYTWCPASGAIKWHAINWNAVRCHVRRLQMRIAKAVKEGNLGKVRSLHS